MSKRYKRIDNLVHYVTNFLFPRRCVICDEVLPFGIGLNHEHICDKCRDKIEFIDDLSCKKCGAKIRDKDEYYCERCKKYEEGETSYYEYGFSLCRYNDYVKESLHRIKYGGRKEYIEIYALLLVARYKDKIKDLGVDCFVPVPIHKDRLRERNYNQAAVLAKHISDALLDEGINIPVDETIIIRQKKTEALNKLSEDKRKEVLKNAFLVNNDKNIKSVCIVDDILTTGNTIESISKILKENGVERIYFITIASVDNL